MGNGPRAQARDPPPALFLRPSREPSHVPSPQGAAEDGSKARKQRQQQQQQQLQHQHQHQQIPPRAVAEEVGEDPLSPPSPSPSPPQPQPQPHLHPHPQSSPQLQPQSHPPHPQPAGLTRTVTSTSTRTRQNLSPNTPLTATHTIATPTTTVPRLLTGDSTRSRATDRTDALWAEMQATLEEVDERSSSSASHGGTRIFGRDHDRALAELRAAQIALAQAWARSEADDAIETGGGGSGALSPSISLQSHQNSAGIVPDNTLEIRNLRSALADAGIAAGTPATAAAGGGGGGATGGAVPTGHNATGKGVGVGTTGAAAAAVTTTAAAAAGDHTDAGKSMAGGTAPTRPGSSGAGTSTGVGAGISGLGGISGIGGISSERLGAKLEQETQTDIQHARKRREANDRYFGRVDQGVRDVVARLEEVAAAMRAVEQETREIWGDGGGSVAGSAKA